MTLTRFEVRDIQQMPDAERVWQNIVDNAPEAWSWHSWNTLELTLAAAEALHPENRSFFVYSADKVVGLVPLVTYYKEGGGRLASYHPAIGFLPSPVCIKGIDREEFEKFVFGELESRAGAGTFIKIRYTPPINTADEEVYIKKIVENFGYMPVEIRTHIIKLAGGLPPIRDRFVRYYKKFSPLFDIAIVEGKEVTEEFADSYRVLHEKDAGRVVRSAESYQRQADTARNAGFFVVATHKETGRVGGMLLIAFYKNVGYDSSVAVDPHFDNLRVGIILKMAAIDELIKRDAAAYDLGPRAELNKETEKERGIRLFKEGFTGGATRINWQLEKVVK